MWRYVLRSCRVIFSASYNSDEGEREDINSSDLSDLSDSEKEKCSVGGDSPGRKTTEMLDTTGSRGASASGKCSEELNLYLCIAVCGNKCGLYVLEASAPQSHESTPRRVALQPVTPEGAGASAKFQVHEQAQVQQPDEDGSSSDPTTTDDSGDESEPETPGALHHRHKSAPDHPSEGRILLSGELEFCF